MTAIPLVCPYCKVEFEMLEDEINKVFNVECPECERICDLWADGDIITDDYPDPSYYLTKGRVA